MSRNPTGSSLSKTLGDPIISKDSIIIQHLESESIANPAGSLKSRSARLHKAEIIAIYPLGSEAGGQPATRFLSIDVKGYVFLSAWKADNSVEVQQIRPVAPTVEATAFSPARSLLAFSTRGRIEVFKIIRGNGRFSAEPVAELASERQFATALDFDPDGQSLIIGGLDGRIYRWLVSLEALPKALSLERYYGHSSAVNSVVYHTFGGLFFSADKQGVLSSWLPYEQSSIQARRQRAELFTGRFFTDRSVRVNAPRGASIESLFNLRVSSDGEYLFLSRSDGSIEVWRVRGFRRLVTQQAHGGIVYDMTAAYLSNGLISIGRDSRLKVWELVKSEDRAPGASSDPAVYKLQVSHQETLEGARRIAVLNGGEIGVGFRTGEVRLLEIVH